METTAAPKHPRGKLSSPQTPEREHSRDAAFGFGRGGWEKPSLCLESTSGLLVTAAAVIQGNTATLGTQLFSLYRKTIYAGITALQPHWEESLAQPAGHNRTEEVLEFPVTQSTSHTSANDHTSEGCCRFPKSLKGICMGSCKAQCVCPARAV